MELKYTQTLGCFDDLYNFCWSGALQTLNLIPEEKQDAFFEYLCETFSCYETVTDVDINDFIWFECDDWIEDEE